jgi:hypothetical protein
MKTFSNIFEFLLVSRLNPLELQGCKSIMGLNISVLRMHTYYTSLDNT